MNRPVLCSILLVAALSYSFLGLAQQQQAATNVIVPRLIRFGGVLKDVDGTPLQGKAGITFGLYKDQDGGAALWLEAQNVSLDSSGYYSVLLGATKEEGIPMDLFTSGAAQWLGVQVQGQSEQPRVLLVSVPYALKAGDADTVGGKPASAFILATPTLVSSSTRSASSTSSVAPPSAPLASVAGSGTTDFVPLWTTSSTLGNSALFQTGGAGLGGRLGIGNKTPAAKLDVSGGAFIRGALNLPAVGTATSVAGANSNSLNLTASVFNSSIGKAVPQTYLWKAEPLFNNTPGASATLNLLFGSGTNTPSETGVLISSGGQIQAPSIFAHNSLHGGTFSANTGSFGTLGIGIIPPQARLDVVGGGSVDSLIGDPGCGVGFAGIGFLPTGKTFGACSNYSLLGDGTNTYINAGPFGFIHFREANATEPMTISNTGRVGIGITTPHATLDVNGTANISGALSTGNLATQVSTTTFTQSFSMASRVR